MEERIFKDINGFSNPNVTASSDGNKNYLSKLPSILAPLPETSDANQLMELMEQMDLWNLWNRHNLNINL